MDMLHLSQVLASDPKKAANLVAEGNEQEVVSGLWTISMDDKMGKQVRKAAKKALYIIKSKGVEVDKYRPVRKKEEKSKPEHKNIIHDCSFSITDSESNYILLFTLTNKEAISYDLYTYIINHEKGIIEGNREQKVSKKLIQRFKQQIKVLFDISPEYGKFRFKKALEVTKKEKIKNFPLLSSLFEDAPDEMTHPVLGILPTNISLIFNQELESELFEQEEILGISIPEQYGKEVEREVEEARNSLLVIGNKTPQERVEDIINRFFSTYFTPQRREVYAVILLDVAYYFLKQEKSRFARPVVEWAKSLRDLNIPPEEHPFLNFLVYKEFG